MRIVSTMASLARFELTTRCLEGNCSVQLSYRDARNKRRAITSFFSFENLY